MDIPEEKKMDDEAIRKASQNFIEIEKKPTARIILLGNQ